MLLVVYGAQGVKGDLDIPGRFVDAVLPGLDFLLLVELGMHFHAVGAEGPQAVEVQAVVGDFLVGVLVAL